MLNPKTTPVIVAIGESIERDAIVSTIEMATRAAWAALEEAPGIAEKVERITVLPAIFSPAPKNPATQITENLELKNIDLEVAQPGGNGPQLLVTRAAEDIASGKLSATLIVGAESTRSMRLKSGAKAKEDQSLVVDKIETEATPDPIVGEPFGRGLTEAELAIKLSLPLELYPLFESALAYKAGRTFAQQREYLGHIYAKFSAVAANNPYAWFQQKYSAEEISAVTENNRLVSSPYTKRFNSFPNVDQGAALIVASLEVAQQAGLEEQVVYIWAGATNKDVNPIERPELGSSSAMKAASEAMFENAGITVDDIDAFELYSCFPSAVGVAVQALGIQMGDPRGLTLIGGLPFFGGPGNNYITHAIAAAVRRLRDKSGLVYVGANGGFLSKHSLGIYGSEPNPRGFSKTDTSAQQAEINADVVPYTLGAEGEAVIEAGTAMYDRSGQVSSAPVFARLKDGQRVAANADELTLTQMAGLDLVGKAIYVSGSPLSYSLLD